jgi:hypothetical protein
VKEICFDNSTNFKGAEMEMKRALLELDSDRINREFAEVELKGKFNPPGAPHFGGVWERLIKTVKQALYAVLKEKVPKEETLQTLLVEVEFLVNNRLLTYVSTDPNDDKIITPNHVLLGARQTLATPRKFRADDECLQNSCVLNTLQVRRKRATDRENLKVSDIVKICDELVRRRGDWPIGRVVSVYPGDDGVVRVVKWKTSNVYLKRPVAKLAVVVLNANTGWRMFARRMYYVFKKH